MVVVPTPPLHNFHTKLFRSLSLSWPSVFVFVFAFAFAFAFVFVTVIVMFIVHGSLHWKQARKLQATLVRNYDLLSDGGEV